MKRTVGLLILSILLLTGCAIDYYPIPTATVESVLCENGQSVITLAFEPAVQQDIILEVDVKCDENVIPLYEKRIIIPAWAKHAELNLKVIKYGVENKTELCFKLLKAYGDCQIGTPDSITFEL